MLRKNSLLFIFLLLVSGVFGQTSNLIFTTNNRGEAFRVFINGKQQNVRFETTVRLENLETKNYRVKVVFQNRILGYIQKDVYIRPNSEKMYSFKPNRQNRTRRRPTNPFSITSPLKLDLVSEIPLYSVDDVYTGESNDEYDAIAYTTGPCPEKDNRIVKYENGNVVIGSEKNNVTIGENGIDINFDIDNIIKNPDDDSQEPDDFDNETETSEGYEDNSTENKVESNSCTPTYSDTEFNLIIEHLKKEGFESKKLAKAKKVALDNCMLTKQVGDVIALFNFENNRVEFAKFAYRYVSDKENYSLLINSFKFETSKQEIREFINE